MVDTEVDLERGVVVMYHLFHNIEVLPVVSEDPLRPWANPKSNQNILTPLSVKNIIDLTEVEEYLVEDIFPHQH